MASKKPLLVVAALALVGCAAFALLRGDEVSRDGLVLSGNVDIRQVELAFRQSGRVARLAVDEGQAVAAGDVLAVLDDDVLTARLRESTAAFERESAALAKAEAGYRSEEVAQAREAVAAAEAVSRNADLQLARVSRLHAESAVSQRTLDNALASARSARADLEARRESLRLHESGYRQEDVAAQRAARDQAQARLELARIAVGDCVLRAPSKGIVLTRATEAGAVVQAGATVFTLTLKDPVWLRVYVPETALGMVRPGDAVEVLCDAAPDAVLKGTVGYISPSAEFTPKNVETQEIRTSLVYRVRVLAEDPDDILRQGMPVRVRLAAAR